MNSLNQKTLVMIVGPAAVGKSTLMNMVTALNDDFARVSGYTSRSPRTNDEPGLYRYVTTEQAKRLVTSDTAVQHAVHPTTGFIYGTLTSDYPKRYNLLDTLSTVVEELRLLPFKRTVTISLTTDPDYWEQWLLHRYPVEDAERQKRLKEAVGSIGWSLNQTTDHTWLVNRPDDLEATARRLIAITTGHSSDPTIPPEAKRLLEKARSLLS